MLRNHSQQDEQTNKQMKLQVTNNAHTQGNINIYMFEFTRLNTNKNKIFMHMKTSDQL